MWNLNNKAITNVWEVLKGQIIYYSIIQLHVCLKKEIFQLQSSKKKFTNELPFYLIKQSLQQMHKFYSTSIYI